MNGFALGCSFFLLLGFSAVAQSVRVTRHDSIDAGTGKAIRRLTHGTTISSAGPFLLRAVVDNPNTRSMTPTSPSLRAERPFPFLLSGSKHGRNNRPALSRGNNTLSAHANAERGLNLTVPFNVHRLGSRRRGPLPSMLTAQWPASMRRVAVPFIDPACPTGTAPQAFISDAVIGVIVDGQFLFSDGVANWCRNVEKPGANRLRRRLLSYSRTRGANGRFVTRTKVLALSVRSRVGSRQSVVTLKRGCLPRHVYVEYCGRVRATGKLLCGTSRIVTVPADDVPEPVPVFRPPIRLELAPGDKATVVTRVRKMPGGGISDIFGNGQFQRDAKFALETVVEAADGQVPGKTPLKVGLSTKVAVPVGGREIRLRDNGTRIYTRYATASCLSTKGSWRGRYPTLISVSQTHKSLVKQDTKPPTIRKQLSDRAAVVGAEVLLTVDAVNDGGGMREGGVATTLTYQWYIRSEDDVFLGAYEEPLAGATGKSLRVKATCPPSGCDPTACSGLQRYQVDVSNTFGCTRSRVAFLDARPPPLGPGERWNPVTCVVIRK